MEQLNPNSRDARLQRLTDEIVEYLTKLGGFVWQTTRTPNGGPSINYVMDGEYYGFYPAVIDHNRRSQLKPQEFEMMHRMEQMGGARVHIITSIERLEGILNMDINKIEMDRILPKGAVVQMLRSWGRGDTNIPRELHDAISGLKFDYRRILDKVYFDRRTFNQLAQDSHDSALTLQTRHSRAVRAVRNALLNDPAFRAAHQQK